MKSNSYSSSYDGFWIVEFEIILHDLQNENDKDKGLIVWLFEGIFHFLTFLNLVLNFSIPNFQFVFTKSLGWYFALIWHVAKQLGLNFDKN
jgi:hypothetical protein